MIANPTKRRPAALVLVLALLWPVTAWGAAERAWHWEDVPRVVAFGDVHGAYDRLVEMLNRTGVIDGQGHWAGGKTHLVSVGDLVDRGPESRKVLDLLMRLEQEAPPSGGQVHVLLGNHEVMNLIGDLRYVSDEEYAAFADEELPADREQAWNRFVERHSTPDTTDDLRALFDQTHPPGFFGLRAAFSPDGVYGSWLLERTVLVRVDGTAFVHGGLSRLVGQSDGAEINRWAMDQLREYLAIVDELEELGVLAPEVGYAERNETARRAIEALHGTPRSAADRATDTRLLELGGRLLELSDQALVFSSLGPLWYRETAAGAEEIEQGILDRALASLEAERVAIGHTPTPDGQILTRLAGRALLIDTGMLEQVYEGRATALIQEGRRIAEFDSAEGSTRDLQAATGVPQPTTAPAPPAGPTDLEMEDFLQTATVVGAERIGFDVADRFRLTLEKDGVKRRALFNTSATSAGNVAAYRLDRLLDLRMVPVAVRRTIQEKDGSLRVWVEEAITEEQRRALDLGNQHQDTIARQEQTMNVFDALIYNEDRHNDSILLTPADWRVQLTDHTSSFLTRTNRPAGLRNLELSPAPELAEAIVELDGEALRNAMEDLLEPAQVKSILKRRKKLVASWTKLGLLQDAAVGAGR